MTPNAPAANPTSLNTNQPFGGFGQAQSDFGSASNILSYLPSQEQQSTNTAVNANNNPGSILPNIAINAPVYTAPTAPTINAGSFYNSGNPSASNVTGYNTAVQNAMTGLTSGENSIYGSAMGSLNSAEQQYGNLTPVYQKLASEYNIPGYQQDVATLSGLLENLNRDVNAQTTLGGGLMNQSARDEMYTNESQPLNTALSDASRFLGAGQNDVSNLMSTYEKSLTNALNPLEQNISTLPQLFSQTNQAAQAGYDQGSTTLENLISNAQRQQEIQASQEQANTYAQMVAKEYGTGPAGMSGAIGSLGQTGNSGNLLPGISFKNAKAGGAQGYDFTHNNAPVSAATWAINNQSSLGATDPTTAITNLLYSMAANGDKTANQAYSAIESASKNANSLVIPSSVMNQYGSLFWGAPGFDTGSPAKPKPSTQPKGNNAASLFAPGGVRDMTMFGSPGSLF